jgi:hypothetical protein
MPANRHSVEQAKWGKKAYRQKKADDRASDLAECYTAKELAVKLIAAEGEVMYRRRRAMIAEDALHSIARGHWTAEGARTEAERAIEGLRNAR